VFVVSDQWKDALRRLPSSLDLPSGKELMMSQVASEHLGESLGTDFFSVREQFTDEQWSHFITVRRFVDEEVVPVIGRYWERAEIAWPLVRRLPELGIVGEDIQGYGCAGMSPMACGLVTMELHRGDGSLGVFLGVHAGLAMTSIAMCGSQEQKARWLPDMARMDKLGAFALTEPEHGSDSVALETSARRDGDSWVLTGAKRWIGLGTLADLVVVWARNTEDGQVNAFVVEKGTPGYQASVIEGKISLRSVWQADITLQDVRVPEENRLAGARSFKDTTRVLATTRSTCAWAALGHATAAYDTALQYALARRQFGEPLASFQIIQQRLVSMLADLTAMQLYCLQIGRLAEAGRLTPTVAGLAKMHNTRKARAISADARDLLGGNGILLDYQVMRHMVDLEAIHTFEGTETMQTLIVGRQITGIGAFT
jgi:glutaryl-CoA dehydrogenase